MNRHLLGTTLIVVALLVGLHTPAPGDELGDALRALEDLTLLRTLQLDESQIDQLIPAVQAMLELETTRQRADDADVERIGDALRQVREALMLGSPLPAEAAEAVEQVEESVAKRAADHETRLSGQIDAVRDLLHPRQIALIEWRSAEERAKEGVKPPDSEMAAFLGMALNAVSRARSLSIHRYWERVDIAADFLATFVPPGTPDYGRRYRRIVEILDRAMRVTPQEYASARVGLAEELLTTVGVGPDSADADRPISREALTRMLTSPATVMLLREMRLAAGRVGRRGR
jgi:hypothetical protein